MPQVQLADIYEPELFGSLTQEAQVLQNRFIQAGAVQDSPLLAEKLGENGRAGELTNFNPLGTEEPDYTKDDPADKSTPAKVDSNLQRFRACMTAKSWSVMDLSRELSLGDPVAAITNSIGYYWARNNEKRVINTCLGLLADNVANDSGDMVYSVATDAAGAVTDAERISADVILTAKQTMGDRATGLTSIAMHSAIYTRLQKQNLIDYIPNARGEVTIPTYLGYIVVPYDGMPAVAGSTRITYTCILFGQGVIGSVYRAPTVPFEIIRDPAAGNGGGQETMFSRRTDLFHPYGFDFLSAALNGDGGLSATQADLALATNWNRIWQRKNLDVCFVQVND